MNKIVAGISAVAMAAGLGVGVGSLANAETATPTPTPSASAGAVGEDELPEHEPRGWVEAGPHGHHAHGRGAADLAGLAEKLGVDVKALQDAMDTVMEGRDKGERPTDPEGVFAEALAKELGIDKAKVTTAMEELRSEARSERAAAEKETLASAVTDGKLTQAEADAVQKALDAGIVGIRHGHPRR